MPAQRGRPPIVRHVRPKQAATGDGPEPFVLSPNQIWSADHPIVRAHPDLFVPVKPDRERPEVEQMTAGPGERRGDVA